MSKQELHDRLRFTAESESRMWALNLVKDLKPFFSMKDEDPLEAARKHVEMAKVYAEYLNLEWLPAHHGEKYGA